MLNENMFQAPKTAVRDEGTWERHLHPREEAVEDCEQGANPHDPLHLALSILVLKYSAFPIRVKY
jgi:hypothetical protein